jgi:hypothetical protein
MPNIRRSFRLRAKTRLVQFTLFPNLPVEIQHEIWALAAYEQVDSLPRRIQAIAPDGVAESRRLPTLDSNLRYRPKTFYPEIQLRLHHRSHSLPALFSACSASRDAIKKLYSVWEKKDGGSVYVNKKKDVIFFGGSLVDYWFLMTLENLGTPWCREDDQIALLQFMAQLRGCRNVAFEVHAWPLWRQTSQKILHWLQAFADMKTMILLANISRSGWEEHDDEFVLPTDDLLETKGWWYKPGLNNLRVAEKELGIEITKVQPVLAVPKGKPREDWTRGLSLHST